MDTLYSWDVQIRDAHHRAGHRPLLTLGLKGPEVHARMVAVLRREFPRMPRVRLERAAAELLELLEGPASSAPAGHQGDHRGE